MCYRGFSRHRLVPKSYISVLGTLGHVHSETINIWSHLLAALFFSAETVRVGLTYDILLAERAVVVLMFHTAAVLCFTCSTLYHLFADHVHARSWQLLDHAGIISLIWASSFSFVAFAGGEMRSMYASLLTGAAAVCILVLYLPSGGCFERATLRIVVHAAFGSSAVLIAFHYWYAYNATDGPLARAFCTLVLFNGTGGAIYAAGVI